MAKSKSKYKIGDKVKCVFAGAPIIGIIERIDKKKNYFSKVNISYWVNDGKYRYPISVEKIEGIVQ